MPRARPEIVMHLAAVAVLVAIGVPTFERGQRWLGGACVAGAVAIAAWLAWAWLRSRGKP